MMIKNIISGKQYNIFLYYFIWKICFLFSLNIPNSKRLETIKFDPLANQFVVKGSLNNFYPDTMNQLIINYVADQNGYRASFRIDQSLPISKVSIQSRLSEDDLKTLAGWVTTDKQNKFKIIYIYLNSN